MLDFNPAEVEGLEPQEAASYFQQFIADYDYSWSFSNDDGTSLDMKAEDRNAAADILRQRLEEYTDFYVDNGWNEDSDDMAFEKNTGITFNELEEGKGDNTYNWGWLYPNDLNFKYYTSPDGRTFLEIRQHFGGDVRGNYGGGYYKELEDQDDFEFISDLTDGFNSVDIDFVDGSSITFGGQQSSDINYFDVVNVRGFDTKQKKLFPGDEGTSEGGIAKAMEAYVSGMKQGSKFDEFVDALVSLW